MRRLAATIVPDAAKRAHERWVTRRRVAAMRGPTDAFVAAHGTTVLHGPAAGLRYPAADLPADIVAKLMGTYELELHAAFAAWDAPLIVDVGCAEGYYAVGLALGGATVHAFDLDPTARARCAALAELNGVGERVQVRAGCAPDTLAEFPASGVALLCDCEGYETTLLDTAAAPVLRGWSIVVELHDFLDPTITERVTARFRDTHRVELIEPAPRAPVPELDGLPWRILLDEYRPSAMRWAVMTPHA